MADFRWRCSRCLAIYAPGDVRYACPACGDRGLLDWQPDYERISAEWTCDDLARDLRRSMWRYGPLLPLGDDANGPNSDRLATSPLSVVGWTPLYRADRFGSSLGLRRLAIKDDARNPTGSLKDRASALVVARAQAMGERTIATASTGNAAAALAGMCASVGLESVIFVPESAPEAKIAQLLIYGASVLLVRGSYDDAFDLCQSACRRWGWYCRNTGYNPYTAEGKKTCALEIAEQLGWSAPDVVIVSVGDGNIITGLHRGFTDLLALGWISRLPRLVGVQASRSPSVHNAWLAGALDVSPARADSVADSINASRPRDGFRALRAMRETGGACLAVEDDAILAAMSRVARTTGVFAEPAGAAAFAGLIELVDRRDVGLDESIVVVNTGSGLKDARAAMRAVSAPPTIEPTLDAVRQALQLT